MWPQDLEVFLADSSPRPHAAASALLADECNITKVHRRIFYELLRTPGFGQAEQENEDDSEGDDGDDQTEDEGGDESAAEDNEGAEGAKGEGNGEGGNEEMDEDEDNRPSNPDKGDPPLSNDDLVRLVTTREKLTSAWIKVAAQWTCAGACEPTKKGEGHCVSQGSHRRWLTDVIESGTLSLGLTDPITAIGELIKLRSSRYNTECLRKHQGRWRKLRAVWWSKIDDWMGLAENE